jgi:toxin ParE1/3/4
LSPARSRGDARFTREALADLRAAVAWIAKDNLAAAEGLRVAASKAARAIGDHPEIGPVRTDLAPERFRFYVLRGYPYVMVYEPDVRPPRILRVLHGAQDLNDVLAALWD